MGGMDLSDVGYDAFLINGKRDSQLFTAHPGEKIRIRIINASASTYFYIALGQKPMKIISQDGVDIKPIFAKEILTGVAETHDLIFEVPDHKNYELRITAQDGTGSASAWIGMGEKVHAPIRPYPDLYAKMSHAGHGGSPSGDGPHSQHGEKPQENHVTHSIQGTHQTEMKESVEQKHSEHEGHQGHDTMKSESPISDEVEVLTVDEIQSPKNTELPKNAKIHNLKLVLSGDMFRYVWHLNGKAIFEDYALGINEGEVVRITYENQTMMHHPMHLHGHFFRVINKYGAYSPLKHTVDVPPHTTRVIEFYANEPGEWMLHCHNLYHLKTGMARVVRYMDFVPKPEIAQHQKHDPHLHDHWYQSGTAEVATNHYQIYLSTSQTWNQIEARFESRNALPGSIFYQGEWEYEGDLFYRRWFGNYFNLIGGGTYFSWTPYAVVGIGYILPMLIETNVLVTQNGKFRLDLDKRIQWSKNFLTDISFTYRPDQAKKFSQTVEWEISLYYAPDWSWAAGLMFTNRDIGVGVQVWF